MKIHVIAHFLHQSSEAFVQQNVLLGIHVYILVVD